MSTGWCVNWGVSTESGVSIGAGCVNQVSTGVSVNLGCQGCQLLCQSTVLTPEERDEEEGEEKKHDDAPLTQDDHWSTTMSGCRTDEFAAVCGSYEGRNGMSIVKVHVNTFMTFGQVCQVCVKVPCRMRQVCQVCHVDLTRLPALMWRRRPFKGLNS